MECRERPNSSRVLQESLDGRDPGNRVKEGRKRLFGELVPRGQISVVSVFASSTIWPTNFSNPGAVSGYEGTTICGVAGAAAIVVGEV